MNTCLKTVALLLIFSTTSFTKDVVFIEAEGFDDHGGWVLDQQFMDLMGSPFLLAHGMGSPVDDAITHVDFAEPGEYQVWIRTRDWVAPWKVAGAPGKFKLLVNGKALETTFGTVGEEWHWQHGGKVRVDSNTVELRLRDLTGFAGRCDAICFSSVNNWQPPNDLDELKKFRTRVLGLAAEPVDAGQFDLVVVGGGIAGTAASVSAARLGLSVALIQDRPVLGGNSSSEVRVWPEGHVNQMPYPRIGDVVMELVPDKGKNSKNAQAAKVFDDNKKMRVVQSEKNIELFLNQRMNQATAKNGIIESVVCQNVRTGERSRIRGRWFLDSTGDGCLGYLVGAEFRQTDKGHMGSSNLWNIKCLCEDEDPLSSQLTAACEEARFPRCPWAVDLTDKPFPGRESGGREAQSDPSGNPVSLGNWFWESGFDRDPINDMERVRDQNFRAVYGAWDTIKNVEKRYPAHRLNWVAYIAGKRESRRLMGDVVLEADDLRNGKKYEDGCVPCTWGIDTHYPHPDYSKGHEGDEFIAKHTHGEGYTYKGPYWLPYRCLYSRNINNLFMAGRDISVTHEALGAVRVMKTTGAMGEVVGMAAAICKQKSCNPREIYERYLDQLQSLMKVGTGNWPTKKLATGSNVVLVARTAKLAGNQVKYEADRDCLGYWRQKGDMAQWKINVESDGQYRVLIQSSCTGSEAGGSCKLITDESEIDFTIPSTGDWGTFSWQPIALVQLNRGANVITIQNQKARGPLMKLRALKLVAQAHNDPGVQQGAADK